MASNLLALYEIKQDILPLGREHNRPGTLLSARGMVMHDTDDPGATDENEDSYFCSEYRASSAHVFIDWDSITQLIPDNEQAWHAGPTANSMYLGCELCVPPTHDTAKFVEVWKRGVWYAALKFFRGGWGTGPGLWSHAGISNMNHETDHQDPIAYFTEYGKTFADFVAEVDAMILAMKTEASQLVKLVITSDGGGEKQVKKVVVYFSSDDYSVALLAANANGGCAMFNRNRGASVNADALAAGKIINIGGPKLGVPQEVYWSGNSAADTAQAVLTGLKGTY